MPSVPHEMLVELLAKSPQLLQPLLGPRLAAVAEADARLRPESLCIRCGQATASQLPVLFADLGLELHWLSTTHPSIWRSPSKSS